MTTEELRGGLRERKKQRTRRDLVAASLDLCARHGFDTATLDDIAARAEVSKRTFFRFFAAKEDAVLAPEVELFDAMLQALRAHSLQGPLIDVLRDAVIGALDGRGPQWHAQFAAALGIIEASPAVRAAALGHCSLVTDRAALLLRERTGADPQGEQMARLTVDVFVAAWRSASARWSQQGAPDPAALRRLAAQACARVVRVPDYTLTPRP
ncbi:DNA-binding transcriptional regulator, AcrR family [Nocardiopsis flavescens]|uniref:DNA-binding transcriptional regulator, AcrR family n=1 Tax=Nocardiopsis flavescens TaxID=758803 RepID=A0A1M6JIW5_9ACTN|nr:TetR family transcriptional regulator [Nocardiopsis flavescens]SHJ46620.1 DNA-binding transcriptional regulator, AcrR family [Nocardiopsis flavescens]